MSDIEKINTDIADVVKFINNGGNVKPFIEDIYLITVDIAGLYYVENIDEIFPELKKGTQLDLYREKNEYDKKAIKIKYNDNKIGYVPRKHNIILANMMDAGKKLYAVVEKVATDSLYENDEYKSVKIKIYLKE